MSKSRKTKVKIINEEEATDIKIDEDLKMTTTTGKNIKIQSDGLIDELPFELKINNKVYATYQHIIKDKDKIKAIDLSHKSLTLIPKKICIMLAQLDTLTELKLNDNYLNKLPKKILKCVNLKKLDLSNNLFCAEGLSRIGGLVNLEELNLSNCGDVSEEICNLVNLKKLDLSNNTKFSFQNRIISLLNPCVMLSHRRGIDDVYKTVASKIFSLDCNKLFAVPKNIAKMTKLEMLLVSNCDLKNIPEQIYLLSNLTYLDFSNNKNKSVLDKISDLRKLTYLNIKNDFLEKIPDSIDKLTKLETFEFMNTKINKLPSTIWNVPCIKVLDLTFSDSNYKEDRSCKITSLPEKNNDRDVKIIINSGTNIPEKIKNVTMYHNFNIPTTFNNIPFDVEELTIHAKVPVKLLNLPSTLKKLSLISSNGNSWIKNYIKTGEIKIPFGCEFNFA